MKKLLLCVVFSLILSTQLYAQSIADSILSRALQEERIVTYQDNEVCVFTNGKDKFNDMLQAIHDAKHHIHIEYFIFANDSIGTVILDAVKQKAAEGVEVRVVVDDYKSAMRQYGFDEARCDSLRAVGVDVRRFDPFKFPYINHILRDHRKIAVIDGRVGYIGGLNIADYYINGDPDFYGIWRDTHVRIIGPAVEGLQRMFADAFTYSKGASFDGASYYPYTCVDYAHEIETSYFHFNTTHIKQIPGNPTQKNAPIAFVERSRDKNAEMREMFIAAFNSAQKKLLIVSPYFMPTGSVRRALIKAVDRGVDVQILLSKVGDEPLLTDGNVSFARRLTKHGAKVFMYNGGFHHSKILMVDDSYAMVGSANLNSRSLRWDYEASCFIFSPEVTKALTYVFEEDKLQCDTLNEEFYKQKPLKKRILGNFVNHFLTQIL